LFQWATASTIKIQLSVFVKYKADLIIIISKQLTCSCHDIAADFLKFVFNMQDTQ
jgi:hypothetical protein